MTGFCDNCKESFFKATSKFCSTCGQQRVFPTTEDVAIKGVHLDVVEELDGTFGSFLECARVNKY